MSGGFWLVVIGCWLLAGTGWCVLFAVLGLRYEVDFESAPTKLRELEPAQDDLAAAA